MGKSGKKPRQKVDAKKYEEGKKTPKKKEDDWSFEDIARSKTRRNY